MATYEWESVTLGQNPEIQKIVSAAAKASELLNTNVGLAKKVTTLVEIPQVPIAPATNVSAMSSKYGSS